MSMTKDKLLAFVEVYQDETEEFHKAQAVKLIRYFRHSLPLAPYAQNEHTAIRNTIRRIEDELKEGLIAGEEACNTLIDAVDQSLTT